jgi:hypothetical protein
MSQPGIAAMHRLAWLILLVPMLGCAHTAQVTWKIDDPTNMATTLGDRVPIGTSIADARRFMEHEGFDCRDVADGWFIERTWFGDDEPKHEGIDFIRCHRSQNLGIYQGWNSLLMSRNWGVALVHDGHLVTDILVSHYLDGP